MEGNSEKEIVRKQFSKNAEKYVQSKSHANSKALNQIVEWLNPEKEWIVLDIATGGGHVAKTLSPHVAQLFSTDITKEMLANTSSHLKEKYKNIWYVLADAERLPFLDHSFEVVTCRIAAHHFPNPEQFIKEVERVLKPDGIFLLIDNITPEDKALANFINELEKRRDKSHVKCLSINEWRTLFKDVGLIEVKSETRKKTYEFPDWVERTTDSQEEVNNVFDLVINADKQKQQYFTITINGTIVQSLQVDEWMVLCKKMT